MAKLNYLKINMRIKGILSTKPLTPEQARVKALKYQTQWTKDAEKAECAKQNIRTGQQKLANII